MSLPIFAPTSAFGDYFWEFAVACNETADKYPASETASLRRFAETLLECDALIAQCRLGLFLDGRWSFQTDSYK